MPEHNPHIPKCGAKNRGNGQPCQQPAGAGTQHVGFGYCRRHGGNTRSQILGAAKLEAKARSLAPMGPEITVDPYDALLRCIWISAGEVQYCTDRIAELADGDVLVRFREQQDGTEGSYVKTSSDVGLHAWVSARRNALDSLARYSKMAIDAGVAERQVALAERVGVMIGTLVAAVLDELELTAGQRLIAPDVVRRHLTQIAAQSAERN